MSNTSLSGPRPFGPLLVRPDTDPVAAASFDREVAALLRSRLLIAAWMMLLAGVLMLIHAHTSTVNAAGLTRTDFAISYALLALEIGLLLVLIRWKLASLTPLRWLELGLFGIAAATVLHSQFRSLHSNWFDDLLTDELHEKALLLIGDRFAVPWMFLIVVYGVFIPNTWRRAATVVALLASMPVLVGILWQVFDPTDWHNSTLGVWLGTFVLLLITGAVAVHGSHKIQSLARQAFNARRLGQYRLLHKLGSGGMGDVYKAEHQLLRRQCAVKLIRPEFASDPVTLQRFHREVKAMSELDHPNTAQVYDFGEAGGTFYYVLEYLSGLNLEELIQREGPLPPGRVIHILRQVLGALGEAHRRGLIHRDVKPGNILLCRRGGIPDFVKLLDFGLVKHIVPEAGTDLTMAGGIAGTPAFMSPEQAMGRHDLDHRTDLYSVGAVGYYLLSARHLFLKDTVYQVLAAHQYENPPPLREVNSGVPADLAKVVMRCLEKNPADRYLDAASLGEALANCAAAEEWTEVRATAWWDAAALDEAAVAQSEVASTLVK